MSATTVDDLRGSPLADEVISTEEATYVDGETVTGPSIKERVAVTTTAAYQFVAKGPRWMKRKAVYAKNHAPDFVQSASEWVGKMWGRFTKFLRSINWMAMGIAFAAVCIWAVWMFIVWLSIAYYILIAFLINPIFGYAMAFFLIGFGISFTVGFTAFVFNTVDEMAL